MYHPDGYIRCLGLGSGVRFIENTSYLTIVNLTFGHLSSSSRDTMEAGDYSYGPSGFKGLVKEPKILALAALASIGGLLFG